MWRDWLLAGLITTVLATPALAGVERADLGIKGMACPFCVFNIEKRLKTLDGVMEEGISTDFDDGIVHIEWNPSVAFDPAAVREQVRRSGFTLGTLDLTFVGTAVRDDEGIRLESITNEQVLFVWAGREEDQQIRFEALTDHVADETSEVRVKGRVVEGDKGDEAWHLRLHQWEPYERPDDTDDADDDQA